MAETLEETAQRIAEKGRDALVSRLRPAFAEAAAAHADVLELDADKLERMVQSAADRADGLQWRRALATVATEELGIGLGEALGHPAVARAQELVGAPSYEESLATITESRATITESRATEPGEDARQAEPRTAGGPEPDPPSAGAEEAETPADEADAGGPGAEPDADGDGDGGQDGMQIRVAVRHLDGLSEPYVDGELELLFTDQGLDVVTARGDASVAHFAWSELHGVEILPGRGRMLRRRGADTRLILSATDRRARFEAPGAGVDELKRRLAPALEKLGGDG